ncbi:MAG: biotin--protein ligase [Alphaproteobacteria bacterium]|nr:biotin--protein ligase [Alphaproteobacteria bacterium]NCQ88663.1 biotin--protein ligase [Alphaproteobacteria bacterium]NCT06206.1 biotin--protein ligase [Alphaproteobacteria bacterium]
MMQKILLYCDTGASAFSILSARHYFKDYQVTLVTAQDIIDHGIPQSADFFVMPGGADIPYTQKLNGKGNAEIRRYVENGGTYLGICAGAYYGCADIEFQKGTQTAICGPRELGFVKGTAIGCLKEIAKPYDTSLHSAAVTTINKQGHMLPVLYWGGCFFNFKNSENITVLATYADIENTPPALISCAVGKGRALLSGVHFEVMPDMLIDYNFDTQRENDLKQSLAHKLTQGASMPFERLIESQ